MFRDGRPLTASHRGLVFAGLAFAGLLAALVFAAGAWTPRLSRVRGASAARRTLDGARPAARSSILRVPHAAAPIVLDGDNDDPGWLATPGPARTGPFVTVAGRAARPHSEARVLWGDGHLYVLLYAADEDVRSRADGFRMTFSRAGTTFAIAVSADGAVRDDSRDAQGRVDASWRSGAHVSREIDGTVDDPRDVDEEWSLETAVPLAAVGLRGVPGERIGFAVERCDAPQPGAEGCGGWGGWRRDDRERGELVIE